MDLIPEPTDEPEGGVQMAADSFDPGESVDERLARLRREATGHEPLAS